MSNDQYANKVSLLNYSTQIQVSSKQKFCQTAEIMNNNFSNITGVVCILKYGCDFRIKQK